MEQLIRDLNSPQNQGRPHVINTIQRQIQALQREPTAWQAALNLLNSDDHILQFYGALTLEQKVNADWETDSIGENRDHVSQLLRQLVTRYVTIATSTESEVVLSKLSSALAAIFGKPDAAWAQPCRHILACILAGQYLPQNQVPSMADLLGADTVISGYALKAVLRLGLAISEGLGSSSLIQTGHRNQVRLSNLASDVWHLLYFTLMAFSAQVGMTPSLPGLQVQSTEHYAIKLLAETVQQIPVRLVPFALVNQCHPFTVQICASN